MALISLFSRLVNGVQRQVDLSTNTIVVGAIQIAGTLLSSSSSPAGSTLVGDNNTYSNFTPTAATVKGALQGIDTALAGTGSAATRALDNLASVAINTSLLPGVDNSINLGSTTKSWAAAYIHSLKDGSNVVSVDAYGRVLDDSSGSASIDWQARQLKSGSTVKLDWSGTDVSLNTRKLINVSDPTSAQDAATKAYVDNALDGRNWKQAVRAASTANVDLSAGPQAGDVIDGVTLVAGDRVLLKDQTAPAENGIYIVSVSGPASRASDADTAAELNGAALSVLAEGIVNKNTQWYETATIVTLGTDPVTFVYLGTNNIFGHDMISVFGTQISVDLATVSGLESTDPGQADGQLRIKLEASNPSLKFTGANELAAKLDPAGAISSGASGLKVNVDNSSIEISSDALRIKSGAYDQKTITGGSGSAAQVAYAPAISFPGVLGFSPANNVTYALRYGIVANSETAGQLYPADIDTSSFDLFWVVGFLAAQNGTLAPGDPITVVKFGVLTLGSGDTAFNTNDTGKALFLQSGGDNASTTAPSTSGKAVAKLGIVVTAVADGAGSDSFLADIGAPYVY